MAGKLKYKKELEDSLPLDFFLIDRIPIPQKTGRDKNNKIESIKHIEKYHALLSIRFHPRKPISKLLDPDDF